MDRLARTRLEQLIWESGRSIREHCDGFNRMARADEPDATLSYRQLARWLAGQVAHARAASMRIAERHWGAPFAVLVGPPFPGGSHVTGRAPSRRALRAAAPKLRPGCRSSLDGAMGPWPHGWAALRLAWGQGPAVDGELTVKVLIRNPEDGTGHGERVTNPDCSAVLGLFRALTEAGDLVVGLQRAVEDARRYRVDEYTNTRSDPGWAHRRASRTWWHFEPALYGPSGAWAA